METPLQCIFLVVERSVRWEFFEDIAKEVEIMMNEKKRRETQKEDDFRNQFKSFYQTCRADLINSAANLLIDDINHRFRNRKIVKKLRRASEILDSNKVAKRKWKSRSKEMCSDIIDFYKCQDQICKNTNKAIGQRLRKFASQQQEKCIMEELPLHKRVSAESFPVGRHFWFKKELTVEDISFRLIIPYTHTSDLLLKSPVDSLLYQSVADKKTEANQFFVDVHTDGFQISSGRFRDDGIGTVGVIKVAPNGDWIVTWTGLRHFFQNHQIVKLEFEWDVKHQIYNLTIFINPIKGE